MAATSLVSSFLCWDPRRCAVTPRLEHRRRRRCRRKAAAGWHNGRLIHRSGSARSCHAALVHSSLRLARGTSRSLPAPSSLRLPACASCLLLLVLLRAGILFADAAGNFATDIINEAGNPRYKYFYGAPDGIVASMKKALEKLGSAAGSSGSKQDL